MNKVFVGFGLKLLASKVDGYKTYTGATGKILGGGATFLSGCIGVLSYMFPDSDLPQVDLEVSLGLLSAGFYAISSGIQGVGVAHKLEKAAKLAAKEG